MSEFFARLKELREKRGLTQKDIAIKFKLGESTVSMYERGQREPDYDLLEQFADFFEVSVDYLLGRTNVRNTLKPAHEEPIVQFLMRTKEEMSPEGFAAFTRLIEAQKKAFMEEVDRKLDGDKK